MRANIRINELTRVVIVGAGLGGLQLAMHLRKAGFQVVIVDKNNYNQFPPLIYQVASAGLEPTAYPFPCGASSRATKTISSAWPR